MTRRGDDEDQQSASHVPANEEEATRASHVLEEPGALGPRFHICLGRPRMCVAVGPPCVAVGPTVFLTPPN